MIRPTHRDHADQPPMERPASLRTAALAIAYAILIACAAAGAASAQQSPQATAGGAADDGALAPYGLSTGSIAHATDAALLWRVVRELVLPQRVSTATGQEVMRRVLAVDDSLPVADALDIHHAIENPEDTTALARIQTGGTRSGAR